jgi:hypothetical protein
MSTMHRAGGGGRHVRLMSENLPIVGKDINSDGTLRSTVAFPHHRVGLNLGVAIPSKIKVFSICSKVFSICFSWWLFPLPLRCEP